MTETGQHISKETYLKWLEELAQQNAPGVNKLIPGVLLEDSKTSPAGDWAKELLEPLHRLGLFLFQGEKRWVEVSCASWEQAELMTSRLVRMCIAAAGLHGSFRGGVVIDLRWCEGEPIAGQLHTLECCLHNAVGKLSPLILAAPGRAEAIRHQLRTLDLQQIVLQREKNGTLEAVLEDTCLTESEKSRLLQQAEQAAPERVESMLRLIRRMLAMKVEVEETQLMACLETEKKPRREIGFGREVEHGTY